MLCTGATCAKKNSCLVARIVSFDTVGIHLYTFRILEQYPSTFHINGIIVVPLFVVLLFESMPLGFPAAKI